MVEWSWVDWKKERKRKCYNGERGKEGGGRVVLRGEATKERYKKPGKESKEM